MAPIKLPCYCGSLRQASRIVTQMYDQALRPAGVKITQFGILRLLAAKPGLTTGEIAEVMVMDSTTLTRTLKIIEGNGWIETQDGEDRRAKYWHLTSQGNQALHDALPLWKSAQSRFAQLAKGLDVDGMTQSIFELVQRIEK